MSLRATPGYWKLRAIGCRGASWSEQPDDKEVRGAPGSARGSERVLIFWTTSPARASLSATVWYVVKGLCKLCCTAVMQKGSTPYFFFFFLNLTYSRWTSSLPSCLWSQRIFPSLPGSRLTIFYRDASSALLQLVNQWLNLSYSRSHAFRYERKNTNPTLVRIELTTSALAGMQVNY